ncbi:hypothetical protein [Pilimelia columellifera]|uniref:Uncharacterized protein n=1 Tax=Pilimelia columellifera subsp. columellifera TaxID=706583 RepID=A0ABP6AXI6_9ACTN
MTTPENPAGPPGQQPGDAPTSDGGTPPLSPTPPAASAPPLVTPVVPAPAATRWLTVPVLLAFVAGALLAALLCGIGGFALGAVVGGHHRDGDRGWHHRDDRDRGGWGERPRYREHDRWDNRRDEGPMMRGPGQLDRQPPTSTQPTAPTTPGLPSTPPAR